jgi:2-methylcitrate dehydratase PrpD
MVDTVSYKLSEFAYNLKLKDVPEEVVSKAKLCILDTLGIMMATYDLENVKRAVSVVKYLDGPPESTVIGHGLKVAAPNAVLANAAMAHSVDYDDTHLGSIAHQSCVVVPTALAMGEKVDASGKEVLESIIAAYEVTARIGLSAPGLFHARGFHTTSIVGVFGSALIAGKLMNLSIEQLVGALGNAGSMVSGLLQCMIEGSWIKAMHPALAAHSGIIASLLAKEGIQGPYQIFEGKFGMFNAYLKGDKFSLENVTKGLGETWETLNISIKPYPTCHATHAPIDIALEFRKKYNIKLEDIEECIYYLPKNSMNVAVEPYEEKIKPATPYVAKFSIPYVAVVAFKNGWVGLGDFTDEAIKDPEILKYTPKIKCVYDKTYDKYIESGSGVMPARAKIITKKGKVYEEEVINHKGTPNNPLTKEDVITKFTNNIKLSKYKEVGDKIIEKVLNMEKHSIKEIMEMLQ